MAFTMNVDQLIVIGDLKYFNHIRTSTVLFALTRKAFFFSTEDYVMNSYEFLWSLLFKSILMEG